VTAWWRWVSPAHHRRGPRLDGEVFLDAWADAGCRLGIWPGRCRRSRPGLRCWPGMAGLDTVGAGWCLAAGCVRPGAVMRQAGRCGCIGRGGSGCAQIMAGGLDVGDGLGGRAEVGSAQGLGGVQGAEGCGERAEREARGPFLAGGVGGGADG
jgi:hypothetical protein